MSALQQPAVRLTPYRRRTISYLGAVSRAGTVLKTYGITRDGSRPGGATLDAAVALAFDHLRAPRPPVVAAGLDWTALREHGVGVLIVHCGREAVFAVLDVWVDENMLRHHVWAASYQGPLRFESLQASEIAACVWELAVVQHERTAWLRHVLTPAGRGDLRAYLDDVFEGDA